MKPYTVVCMKWGVKYGPQYVNRLYNMTARNTTLPFHFICFTDNGEGLLKEIEVRPLPEMALPPGPERGWRKLSLFSPHAGLSGRVLFLDLDTVIVGNIDDFFTLEGQFILIRHWRPSAKQGPGETAVYRFEAEAHADLYTHFMEHMDEVKAAYRHEQAYVGGMLTRQGKISFWPREWMPSFKYNCLPPFPLCYFKEAALPPKAKMIVFHGNPTPDMALEGKNKGLKGFFRHVRPPQWLKEKWR